MKPIKPLFLSLGLILSLALATPLALAKHGEGEAPPGWNHGKKTGWDGEDLPPGLAKKHEKEKSKGKKEAKEKKEELKKEKKEKKEREEEGSEGKVKKKSRLRKILTWPFGQGDKEENKG